jgi:hypothetical protein
MTPQLIEQSLATGYAFIIKRSDSPSASVAVGKTYRSATAFEDALNEALLEAPFHGRHVIRWQFATDDRRVLCRGELALELSTERIDLTKHIIDFCTAVNSQSLTLDVRTRVRAQVMQYVAWTLRAEVARARVARGYAREQAARRALEHRRRQTQRRLLRTLGEALMHQRVLKDLDAFGKSQHGVVGLG